MIYVILLPHICAATNQPKDIAVFVEARPARVPRVAFYCITTDRWIIVSQKPVFLPQKTGLCALLDSNYIILSI